MFFKYSNLHRCYDKLVSIRAVFASRKLSTQKFPTTISRISPVSKRSYDSCLSEYGGLLSVLKQSGIVSIYQRKRYINTSSRYFNEQEDAKAPPKKPPKKPKKDNKYVLLFVKGVLWVLTAYTAVGVLYLLIPNNDQDSGLIRYVSWNEFVHQMLAKGEVKEIIVRPDIDVITIILHDNAIIKNKRTDHRVFALKTGDINKFEEKMREAERRLGIKAEEGVPIIFDRGSDSPGKWLASLIVLSIVLSLISRGKMFKPPININSLTQIGRAKFTLVDPMVGQGKGVKFADVAGLMEAKQEVMEFVDYLKRPMHYKALGAKVPKGALLLGPPGCGKTLLAKAVATEANVPFLSMNGSEFIEMIGGLGAARVRDLFKEGRKRRPCIIYIDEIDAIGKKRSDSGGAFDGGTSEEEQTLNQLLVELDGITTQEGVILLASTNRAVVLDKALLRPGRFDRHILIDLPNLEERRQIFEQHLKSVKLENKPEHYSKRMARLTPGFSGADIANVSNEAALHAARHKKKLVQGSDLEYAIERVVGGTEKRSSTITPGEKKIIAYHESGHALVGWLLEHTDALLKVTIVPRTNLALGFAQYTPKDQHLYSQEQLFDKMCMALGGRVAESITFNAVTTGAQNDLQKVTRMAYAQIQEFGMSKTVGLVSFSEQENKELGRRPFSKKLAAVIDEEARRLVAKAYFRTEQVLRENKDKLETMAHALLQKEVLNYDDVEKLLGPPPHGSKTLIEPIEFELSINQAAGPEPTPKENEPESQRKAQERTE